jgi:5-methylcytosine-specific restriction endonuclease McrBC GTP-binding regulatory subunit McrB
VADRNPNIPIERVREHESKARNLYEENQERAAEKKARLDEIATQNQEDPMKADTSPAGTPSEKKGGDFPG